MHILSLNEITFVLAVFELLLGSIFVIPLPFGLKLKLLNFVEKSNFAKRFLIYHNFAIFLVGLHWIYSIKVSADLQDLHVQEKTTHFQTISKRDLYILEQKFKAEGDIYLNGTLLFVSIFINRLIALLQYYYKMRQTGEKELNVDLTKSLDSFIGKMNVQKAGFENDMPVPSSKIPKALEKKIEKEKEGIQDAKFEKKQPQQQDFTEQRATPVGPSDKKRD